ncbi:MAG: hypothetical protein RL695_511 [Pseudomonadota bacterium]
MSKSYNDTPLTRSTIDMPFEFDPAAAPSDDEPQRPSKSQRKRDSDALQSLGKELIELSKERLAKITMSDALRGAVREAQRLTKNEAKRRQLQYIGKLMRAEDPTPIRAALDEIAGISSAANERMHRLERLRQQLLDDEALALSAITADHPRADLQQLRQLRRNALKESEQNKPPRAFREIFQLLKALEEARDDA